MSDIPYDLDDDMQPVFEASKYLKMLIYGDPKVGKTTFAGTAPAPLFLAVEPGVAVLNKNTENRERFKNVRVVQCSNKKKLDEVVKAIRAGKAADRETVVLDTLTEFEDRTLEAYMNYAIKTGLTENKNPNNPQWPEYKAVTSILKKAMIELRDLDKHVIVICHCRDDPDKRRGGMSIDRPALMPKLGQVLEGMFNLVGYMFVDHDGTHKMRVVPTPNIIAGNHIWSGEPIIDNPTFEVFLKGRD